MEERDYSVVKGLIEQIPSGILVVDESGEIVLSNSRFYELFDFFENDNVSGMEWSEVKESIQNNSKNNDIVKPGEKNIVNMNDGKFISCKLSDLNDDTINIDGRIFSFQDVTQSKNLSEKLRSIHEKTRFLMHSETREDVYKIILDIFCECFDMGVSGIWDYNVVNDTLEPVFWTEKADNIVGDHPVFTRGNGLVWEAFKENEIKVYREIEGNKRAYNKDSPIKSEIITPLDKETVLIIGSTEENSFSEEDIKLIQIVSDIAKEALVGIQRNKDLELTRQVLSRLLRHNTRQMVNILFGKTKELERMCENCGNKAKEIQDIGKNISGLSKKSTRLQKIINERERRDLIDIVDVVKKSTAKIKDEYPNSEIKIYGPNEKKAYVHPKLNLGIENLIENGIKHNESENPKVEIIIREIENGTKITIEDNGPGIPENEIKALVEKEQETDFYHSLGLGLWTAYFVIKYSDGTIDFNRTDNGTKIEVIIGERPNQNK